jgi:hypothetical protein
MLERVLVLALAIMPAAAAAQGAGPGQGPPSPPSAPAPSTPAHPVMPWGSGISVPYGQLIRYVYMPPQPVTLEYLVPVEPQPPSTAAEPPRPGSEVRAEATPPVDPGRESPPAPGPQVVRQQVTVPGYYVRETTVGFHYPERWVIEQTGVGAYRWRLLPAQFVPKR